MVEPLGMVQPLRMVQPLGMIQPIGMVQRIPTTLLILIPFVVPHLRLHTKTLWDTCGFVRLHQAVVSAFMVTFGILHRPTIIIVSLNGLQ